MGINSVISSDSTREPEQPVIALLMPGYSPSLDWLGRALLADVVVLDDLHPFSRKSRVHRTRVRTSDGFQWLVIPFASEDRRKPLCEVRIDRQRPWVDHHLKALEYNYRNSTYFDYYEPEIRADLTAASHCELLLDAVMHLMQRQWSYAEITLPYTQISSISSHSLEDENLFPGQQKNKRVWQEAKSRHYQKPHPDAVVPDLSIPEYKQRFPGFVEGCGMLDLLFTYGPDMWQVLDRITAGSADQGHENQ